MKDEEKIGRRVEQVGYDDILKGHDGVWPFQTPVYERVRYQRLGRITGLRYVDDEHPDYLMPSFTIEMDSGEIIETTHFIHDSDYWGLGLRFVDDPPIICNRGSLQISISPRNELGRPMTIFCPAEEWRGEGILADGVYRGSFRRTDGGSGRHELFATESGFSGFCIVDDVRTPIEWTRDP